MEQVYVDAVKKATLDLYGTMMSMELAPGDVTTDRSCLQGVVAITGMIGLAGPYKGNIAIHFSKDMALKSIEAMLGMAFDDLTDETKDAIGEIANIIAGGVKTELSASGIDFDLSLPTVISGENYQVFFNEANAGNDDANIVDFTFEGKKMFVEFDLKLAE